MSGQASQSTPSTILEQRIMDPNIPKNEQEHWAANEIHRLRDILGGGCPMHPRVSLLDRIHGVRDAAETYGSCDIAQWLRKHADEPCPAAMAQAMEMGEPRECVQTVNRFGYSLIGGCSGADFHAVPDADCGHPTKMAGCGHHEPLYAAHSDPPAPDASRTDAVREAASDPFLEFAISLVKRHAGCDDSVCSVATSIAQVCECPALQQMRPLLAALADAERKCQSLTETAVIRLAQIADAEQRAKDAERFSNEMQSSVGELREIGISEGRRADTLTRNLATARETLSAIVRSQPDHRCTEHDFHPVVAPCTLIARNALAAIDVPAAEKLDTPLDNECSSCGEECAPLMECPASRRPCGHHCNCSWSQDECCWCDKEFGEEEVTDVPQPSAILPPTHIADPDDSFHGGAASVPSPARELKDFIGATCGVCRTRPSTRTAAYERGIQYLVCGDCETARLRARGDLDPGAGDFEPPPEPANAQGSEAECFERPGFPGALWAHMPRPETPLPPIEHDGTSPLSTNFFPPPFTAEEARTEATHYEREAAGYRSTQHQPNAADPEGHEARDLERRAVTLRSYADLLDREDALERAAKSMLNSWDIGERGTALNMRIRDLRSVLAQCAKGRL